MQDDLQTLARSKAVPLAASFSGSTGRSHGQPLAQELTELVMPSPGDSYLFRISGHAWTDQGILDGDIAVVDRKRVATDSDLVISWHDSGFSICRSWQLLPGNEAIGVITAVIHSYK